MFTLALITIFLFPLALGVSTAMHRFSSDELEEMGICLDSSPE